MCPNKYFSDVTPYLVEGSKDKGYLKNGKQGFGDGKTSNVDSSFSHGYESAENYFEGKKGKNTFTVKR